MVYDALSSAWQLHTHVSNALSYDTVAMMSLGDRKFSAPLQFDGTTVCLWSVANGNVVTQCVSAGVLHIGTRSARKSVLFVASPSPLCASQIPGGQFACKPHGVRPERGS